MCIQPPPPAPLKLVVAAACIFRHNRHHYCVVVVEVAECGIRGREIYSCNLVLVVAAVMVAAGREI